jgi:hypothetical protein
MLRDFPGLDPAPTLGPRGGLGLYVYRGAAAFKAVTIQPLPIP